MGDEQKQAHETISPSSAMEIPMAVLGSDSGMELLPVEPPLPLHSSIAYIDWRLVNGNDEKLPRRQNLMTTPGGDVIHIHEVAEQGPDQVRRVYLVSGLKGVRTGRLLRNHGYIGSRAGQDMCRVWSLVLDDGEGLKTPE
jgi:hypothetical protein